MNNDEEKGMNVLYNMLVKGAEFPGTTEMSPASLNKWISHLETLSSIMMQFYSSEMTNKYREVRNKITVLSKGPMDDRHLLAGYDVGFELLGVIGNAFAAQELLAENPNGVKIIYDLFVEIADFSRVNSFSPASILQLFNRIRGLHFILASYMGEPFQREYRIIARQLREASSLPLEEYIPQSREWLLNWVGLIARVLQERGILIPEEFSFSDRIGGAKK